MSNFINKLYQNNTIVYKVILFLVTAVAIVYLFPKGGQFKYNFDKGKLWQYENLYARFDFAIQKTEEEIFQEKKEIDLNAKLFFEYNEQIVADVKNNYESKIGFLNNIDSLSNQEKFKIKELGSSIINKVYNRGFVNQESQKEITDKSEIIALRKNNLIENIPVNSLFFSRAVLELINTSDRKSVV